MSASPEPTGTFGQGHLTHLSAEPPKGVFVKAQACPPCSVGAHSDCEHLNKGDTTCCDSEADLGLPPLRLR